MGDAQGVDQTRDRIDRIGANNVRREAPPLVVRRDLLHDLIDGADEHIGRGDDVGGVDALHVGRDNRRGRVAILGDPHMLHGRVDHGR